MLVLQTLPSEVFSPDSRSLRGIHGVLRAAALSCQQEPESWAQHPCGIYGPCKGEGSGPCQGGRFAKGASVMAVAVTGIGVLSAELLGCMERASSCWEAVTQSFSASGSPAAKIHTWEASPEVS